MSEEEQTVPLGIMLYGYDDRESGLLQGFLSDVFEQPILVLSASGKEDVQVQDILESPSEAFEDKDVKVLMFLGFDDQQIGTALNEFPRDGSVTRPIFCGLTEQNITWPLSRLIEHLLEEKRYWESREAARSPPGEE